MPIYHTLMTIVEWLTILNLLVPIFNLLVLTITLVVLIDYARDTNRIANQTQEANLRPVILRGGYISEWHKLTPFRQSQSGAPTIIIFNNLKNIATDIKGWIIIDSYRYQLHFANEVTKVETSVIASETSEAQVIRYGYVPKWGWIQADALIYAIFLENGREPVNEENHIRINYRDIEGNEFFTIEDSNFVQKCFKK